MDVGETDVGETSDDEFPPTDVLVNNKKINVDEDLKTTTTSTNKATKSKTTLKTLRSSKAQ